MSEEQVVRVGRPHRSEFAIKQLVEEFVISGLRQGEFCRRHSVSVNSLKRYLDRDRAGWTQGRSDPVGDRELPPDEDSGAGVSGSSPARA
jgi:hypothetical protein